MTAKALVSHSLQPYLLRVSFSALIWTAVSPPLSLAFFYSVYSIALIH
jgi:hypothetical protein